MCEVICFDNLFDMHFIFFKNLILQAKVGYFSEALRSWPMRQQN